MAVFAPRGSRIDISVYEGQSCHSHPRLCWPTRAGRGTTLPVFLLHPFSGYPLPGILPQRRRAAEENGTGYGFSTNQAKTELKAPQRQPQLQIRSARGGPLRSRRQRQKQEQQP